MMIGTDNISFLSGGASRSTPTLQKQEQDKAESIAQFINTAFAQAQQATGSVRAVSSAAQDISNDGQSAGYPPQPVSPATLIQAQIFSENNTTEEVASTPLEETKKDAAQEFLDYMDKSPIERMREQILRQMGLTEESLKALPPEERQKIEEQIASIIEERIKEAIGANGKPAEAQAQQAAVSQPSASAQSSSKLPFFNERKDL